MRHGDKGLLDDAILSLRMVENHLDRAQHKRAILCPSRDRDLEIASSETEWALRAVCALMQFAQSELKPVHGKVDIF